MEGWKAAKARQGAGGAAHHPRQSSRGSKEQLQPAPREAWSGDIRRGKPDFGERVPGAAPALRPKARERSGGGGAAAPAPGSGSGPARGRERSSEEEQTWRDLGKITLRLCPAQRTPSSSPPAAWTGSAAAPPALSGVSSPSSRGASSFVSVGRGIGPRQGFKGSGKWNPPFISAARPSGGAPPPSPLWSSPPWLAAA